jgi:hypothetical protein
MGGMMPNQKERAIIEKRTIEATKKNLTGPSGKLGVIVRNLGSPIIRQGSSLMDVTYLEDPYEIKPETEHEATLSGQKGPVNYKDEILSTDEEVAITHEGYIFDGLSRGLHIEIKYFKYNHSLEVNYKGFRVYREVAGELEAYAPFPEWETIIDRLHRNAKNREKETEESAKEQIKEEVFRKKKSFWEKMRMRWGL